MIQRMGRVLRAERNARMAMFIVVYATNTTEDITQSDGAEGCLDLIVQHADSTTAFQAHATALTC
jgi:superfamily II DNA or RNA helicase